MNNVYLSLRSLRLLEENSPETDKTKSLVKGQQVFNSKVKSNKMK